MTPWNSWGNVRTPIPVASGSCSGRSSQEFQRSWGQAVHKYVGTSNGYQGPKDKESSVYHLFLPMPVQHCLVVSYSGEGDHGIERDEGGWHKCMKKFIQESLKQEPPRVDMRSHLCVIVHRQVRNCMVIGNPNS